MSDIINMESVISIGLFGLGCVGQGFYDILNDSAGTKANIVKVCVKNRGKERVYPELKYTFDSKEIFDLETLDVIVELTDDSEKAFQIVREALKNGISVVTANKKMLAEHFTELFHLQKEGNVSLLYEASVAGSVPIIRSLEEYYNDISLSAIRGILNGTCNYILTKMEQESVSYQNALEDCREMGFVETDPWLDVSGEDSKFKILLLTIHGFGVVLQPDDILNLGINCIHESDITYAKEKSCRIKLVATTEKTETGLSVFVMPHFIPEDDALYHIMYENNAVNIETAYSCNQVISGKGAGKYPTGSAVISDVLSLSRDYSYSYEKLNRKMSDDFFESSKDEPLEDEFLIKLYIRFSKEEQLKNLEIFFVEEEFSRSGYKVLICKVKFKGLFSFMSRKNEVFVARIME